MTECQNSCQSEVLTLAQSGQVELVETPADSCAATPPLWPECQDQAWAAIGMPDVKSTPWPVLCLTCAGPICPCCERHINVVVEDPSLGA
jgi:hypothetical protein